VWRRKCGLTSFSIQARRAAARTIHHVWEALSPPRNAPGLAPFAEDDDEEGLVVSIGEIGPPESNEFGDPEASGVGEPNEGVVAACRDGERAGDIGFGEDAVGDSVAVAPGAEGGSDLLAVGCTARRCRPPDRQGLWLMVAGPAVHGRAYSAVR